MDEGLSGRSLRRCSWQAQATIPKAASISHTATATTGGAPSDGLGSTAPYSCWCRPSLYIHFTLFTLFKRKFVLGMSFIPMKSQ